jgi:hypothetical protein
MTLLTTAFAQGTHAARPAAATGNAGYYYYETDTTNLFQSTGSAWQQVASQGGGGGGSGIVQVSVASRTSGDLTTASTSFVDATGLTTTITTGAHRCLVFLQASGNNSANNGNTATDLAIDGTRQGGGYGLAVANSPAAAGNGNLGFVYLTSALSAASHTLKIQWRVDAGTGTMFASTTVCAATLTVIELGL